MDVQLIQEWIPGSHCTHRWDSAGSRSSVSTIAPITSSVLSHTSGTFNWMAYVWLDAMRKLLSTHCKWRLQGGERYFWLHPKFAFWKTTTPPQQLSESGPLEFVTMDIIKPTSKALSGNQLILVMKDRYTKLTKAVLTSKKASSHIASLFSDNLVVPYEISEYVLSNIGTQLISKFYG